MKIMSDTLDYLTTLSRLDLPVEERDQVVAELEKIVTYMDLLEELPTEGVEPLTHIVPLRNVLREDTVRPSYLRDELLSCAPAVKDGAYLVPRTVE